MPPDLQRRALRRLDLLAAATDLRDLRIPPSNRLERLQGSLAGAYSIRINDQWRVVFEWHEDHAYEVAVQDYH
jgi:proteic killer suppression protein